MRASEERQIGRAKNVVLSFFERKLSVPRIYMDADWVGHKVDVLAIDRDGVGDVHAALFFQRRYDLSGDLDQVAQGEAIEDTLAKLKLIEAQFKYVVAVEIDAPHATSPLRLSDKLIDESYAQDGVGRVGILRVHSLLEDEPDAKLDTKPERFRAKIAALADEYVAKHTADWELRA